MDGCTRLKRKKKKKYEGKTQGVLACRAKRSYSRSPNILACRRLSSVEKEDLLERNAERRPDITFSTCLPPVV